MGLLVSFFLYVNHFYNPLRQLAVLWASFQSAMASWDRVHEILVMESDLKQIPASEKVPAPSSNIVLEFKQVHFGYSEQLLESILKTLPVSTTRVIIAHRLNTIKNADEIFFVNAGKVIPAGRVEHAVELLLGGKRES